MQMLPKQCSSFTNADVQVLQIYGAGTITNSTAHNFLSGLNHLTSIFITSLGEFEIPDMNVSSLDYVVINYNTVNNITQDIFAGCTGMIKLDLLNNNIKVTFGQALFNKIINRTHLYNFCQNNVDFF